MEQTKDQENDDDSTGATPTGQGRQLDHQRRAMQMRTTKQQDNSMDRDQGTTMGTMEQGNGTTSTGMTRPGRAVGDAEGQHEGQQDRHMVMPPMHLGG